MSFHKHRKYALVAAILTALNGGCIDLVTESVRDGARNACVHPRTARQNSGDPNMIDLERISTFGQLSITTERGNDGPIGTRIRQLTRIEAIQDVNQTLSI